MVLGSSATVFFSGMPSEAAGPVADSVTPTFTSAQAVAARPVRMAPVSTSFFNFMGFVSRQDGLQVRPLDRARDP